MTTQDASSGAILVFDRAGRLAGASPGAAGLVGRAETLDDLRAALVELDGTPLDLSAPGAHPAVRRRDNGSMPVSIAVERLDRAGGSDLATAVVVTATPAGSDAVTIQQVLGSVLAHELRTPLTTIFGGAQLIADPGVADDTKQQAASSVTREAEHLHRIVEDLVELVRGGREELEPEPLLVQRIVPRIVAVLRALRPDAKVAIALPADLPPVLAVEPLLDHLLTNLLAHGLTYASADGGVSITAGHQDGHVQLRVEDDGPGRDDGEASAAFDLFHRSPRTSADRSGANVSLAVSRRIVERMGGQIQAVSRPTGGELVVALPVANGVA